MGRLDLEKQKRLEPGRIEYAIKRIEQLGYVVNSTTCKSIEFEFKGSMITYFPYSGWASGKTIKDGRGLENLVNQIRKKLS